MQRIDLTGDVFQRLQKNNLMIDKTHHTVDDQSSWKDTKQWMIRNPDIPKELSNIEVVPDQPHGRGYPILGPIQRIRDEEQTEGEDEEQTEGTFRFPSVGEMGAQKIEELIEKQGTDALAWYRPFHMDPQEKWGITILDQGIWYLARKLAIDLYGERDDYIADEILNCRDIAKNFLYHHEMFHFKVELAATMMEMNRLGVPIYARYWGPNRGGEWFGSPSEVLRGHAPLEEALANSYAREKVISEFSKPMKDKVRIAINEFMKSQPEGYKQGSTIKGKNKKWTQGVSELIDKLLNEDDDGLSPQRILASHVLFDGAYGREDWIEEYYELIVPCRILNTGFAHGRFSESTDDFRWRDFCLSTYYRNEWKDLMKSNHVLIDMQLACDEFTKGYMEFRKKGARRARLWERVKGVKVMYFRICSQKYRVYHQKWDDQEVLLAIHQKRGNVTPPKVAKKLRKGYYGPVITHNKNCPKQ